MARASPSSPKASVIQAVQTPLGFFALVVLAVEAILGVTAGFVRGVNSTEIVWAMIALIFLMVLIVTFLAYHRPEALGGRREESADVVSALPSDRVDSYVVDHLKRPSIVCVSTVEFESLGAAADITAIQQYFSKGVDPHRNVTLNQFRTILTTQKIDILHLLCFVDGD